MGWAGLLLFVASGLSGWAAELTGDKIPANQGEIVIHPIEHATFVLGHGNKTIYVDPVGDEKRFAGLPEPDLILVTDVHGDHLNEKTIAAVAKGKTEIVAPAEVIKQLKDPAVKEKAKPLANGETKTFKDVSIEAVPMYNLTADRLKFHTKGRGNGYVVTLGGKRIYISGDTEDIPEMRALKNIDVAFVCMNLPYTMEVEKAASAVREFAPKIVYPYHYRGSDVESFKKLVEDGKGATEVRLRNWYPPKN
jgi:L-ascorbate metabolism protein UlaG (beta-lactamase superfamily)